VSPWASVTSDFSPLVFAVPFDAVVVAGSGGRSPLLSGMASCLTSSSSPLISLSRAGLLASGWSFRDGEDASSRGRLVDCVGCGEVDILFCWLSRLDATCAVLCFARFQNFMRLARGRALRDAEEIKFYYRFFLSLSLSSLIYTLGFSKRKRAGIGVAVLGSGSGSGSHLER
jgi:hypothetical protein